MTQTALEWFVHQIGPFLEMDKSDAIKVIEQAKAMEETNMITFGKHCLDKALDLDIRTAHSKVEQYYNETYNK